MQSSTSRTRLRPSVLGAERESDPEQQGCRGRPGEDQHRLAVDPAVPVRPVAQATQHQQGHGHHPDLPERALGDRTAAGARVLCTPAAVPAFGAGVLGAAVLRPTRGGATLGARAPVGGGGTTAAHDRPSTRWAVRS
jgi:hypothetical protein